jgi:23S rRNA pseudouridine1911/1915/1917 synthase
METPDLPRDRVATDGHELLIDARENGMRLDQLLALLLSASRAEARRVLARGGVAVDGRAVGMNDKGTALAEGQRLTVEAFTPEAEQRPIAEPEAALEIVAQGEGWIAVDKPPGTAVHPLAQDEKGTLLGAVCARFPEIIGVGEGGLRCGVVHRLDVDTSGVLLFATEEERWHQLRTAFRRHRVEKTYRALVHGRLDGEGDLALHLAVGQHRPARVRVVEESSPDFGKRTRHTRMAWRALRHGLAATLVEVKPRTGFLHQIRVSLAHLGHPVIGDTAYGAPPSDGIERHLLHAARVGYADVRAGAKDASDFADALEQWVG